MTFAFVVFNVALFRVFLVNWSPLSSINNFGVRDVKEVFFSGEFVGFPTAFLIVVLDNEPEVIQEVEFYGKV